MNELLDWLGTPIRVGSTIVYPQRKGSAQWMTKARVLEVNEVPDRWGRSTRPALKVHRIRDRWDNPIKERVTTTLVAGVPQVTVIA